MVNHQPPEPISRESNTLEVKEIFHTIQGEGPFTGTPAIFIRLSGCNLQCPMCDTDYTSTRRLMFWDEVIVECKNFATGGLVVITGGEPFRQYITTLLFELVEAGYYVQIETNGTLAIPGRILCNPDPGARAGVYVVVSPKTGRVHPTVEAAACAYKYVMRDGDTSPIDGLPFRALEHPASPQLARPPKRLPPHLIYIQPLDEYNDERNDLNLKQVVRTCMVNGYTLQLQTHKILNLP